jgi:peptide/nickel transport system substrate-binding protein
MTSRRREFLQTSFALVSAGAVGILPGLASAAGEASGSDPAPGTRGGSLSMGIYSEPNFLTSAFSTAGPPLSVSTKIFDGLLDYDEQFRPRPKLAIAWESSGDGLTLTLKLRRDVTWHDGKPFTSADVAWSLENVWKKLHPQGRITYAHVAAVETPDAHTVVIRLDQPSPYILSALHAGSSQVLPRHLYEGRDVLTNPINNAPIGTGPFRFSKWQRGGFIELARNPDYWIPQLPYLDKVLFRFFPDSASASVALETNAVQLATSESIPQVDIQRLAQDPNLAIVTGDSPYTASVLSLDFNLDRPVFKDVRVREALYHAVDRAFIAKNIYYGFALPVDAPLPPTLPQFYTEDVPRYSFDPKRADALLDAAGLKRDSNGVRFAVSLDSNPKTSMMQASQYLRAAYAKVGVKVDLQSEDFGAYVTRIYTDRVFDLGLILGNVGPDPVIGMQRFFASSSYSPGVPFSNGAHYVSAQADLLLSGAQREIDPKKRKQLYDVFQRLVQTDLPRLPLVSLTSVVLHRKTVHNVTDTTSATLGNFANLYVTGA